LALVLTRKPGEAFYVGPDIRIVFVRATGEGIRLAIEAPRDVLVLREELVPPQGMPGGDARGRGSA
jgi:carbon storage regulator